MNQIKTELLTQEDTSDNLKDTLKRIAISQKRGISKENKRHEILEQIMEADELNHIKPTDDETMNKILSFAMNVDKNMYGSLENSPQRRNGLKQQMSQPTLERAANLYQTMTIEPQGKTSMSRMESSVFAKSKFEKMMIHKLAYEWKNIYRHLTQIDTQGLGVVSQQEFQLSCEKAKVSIIPLEMKQLMLQFGVANNAEDLESLAIAKEAAESQELINYKRLSI